MDRRRLKKDLRRSAPDHHLAGGLGLELRNVVANLVRQVALVLAGLRLLRCQALDVVLVECGGHRLDRFEIRPDRFKLVVIEHLRGLRGVVQVAAEDVPPGKDEVVELRDGSEVFDQRAAAVGAFSKPDGAHLGRRSNGLCKAFADCLYSRDQCGGNGPHAGDHDAEFSSCRLDAGRVLRRGAGC